MKPYDIFREQPDVVDLVDEGVVFGEVQELTSRAIGADKANIARVTLYSKDILHHHKEGQETYICEEGEGILYLKGVVFEFNPGDRVIINPGTTHAAGPKEDFQRLVFLCVSSPAFDPSDFYPDPRGRNW